MDTQPAAARWPRRIAAITLVLTSSFAALFWWVDQQFNGRPSPTRITNSDLRTIEITLLRFRSLNSRFPSQDEGLAALVTPPAGAVTKQLLAEEGNVDEWGNPFVYHVPGTRSKSEYDLFSIGPDGKEGTSDDIHAN